MRVVLVNNVDFANGTFWEHADVCLISPRDENIRDRLFAALKKQSDATLLIDSELKRSDQSSHQALEGLKIAYECRTHPGLRYCGFIKLLGFLPLGHVKQNRFGGLLRSGEKIHAKEFTLRGASYFRYPDVDLDEGEPLSEAEWHAVVEELDEIFVQEFRRFEHGFRNLIIANEMDAETRMAKREELVSHLNTLEHIERSTVIQQRFRARFDSIRADLSSLTDSFKLTDDYTLGDRLSEIKSGAGILRVELMTLTKVQ